MNASRIIIVGRNDQLPRFALCPYCDGDGYFYDYPVDPSAKPYKVPCALCKGEGGIERPAAVGGLPVVGSGRSAFPGGSVERPSSLQTVAEVFTTVAGLCVFGVIAGFFWGLA